MAFIYFALLLGGLIFFHELGHFLAGKAMGVRVLKFAIGFGPSLVRFKRGETVYTINLLPLGGYVKFFGDDPTEELAPEERRGSFNYAPLPRRFLIVLAGPVFNLILPFLIFFPMFAFEGDSQPAVLGHVVEGGPAAEAGLQSGDRIVRIDGEPIDTWWEMQQKVEDSAGKPLAITVDRGGETVGPITVTPEDVVVRSIKELDWEEHKGRINVTHQAFAPVVAVAPGSAADQAGLRTGDRIVSIGGEAVGDASLEEVMRRLRAHAGQTISLTVRRDGRKSDEEPSDVGAADLWNPVTVQLPVRTSDAGGVSGLASAELVVTAVEPDTPAQDELLLMPGDRLMAIDGKPLHTWSTLQARLTARPEAEHTIRYERGSVYAWLAGAQDGTAQILRGLVGGAVWEAVDAAAEPGRRVVERTFRLAEVGKGASRHLVFGARHEVDLITPEPISLGFGDRVHYAAVRSVEETWHAYKITVLTVVGLFAGRVPVKDLGGPILIADLAAKTQQRGWSYFFFLMVWLSINLGILNLLPVPILDGGHLMFFTIEAIKRKPLSLRTRQIASYVGLAIIVLLMAVAFKNDLERYWESITGFGCSVMF